MMGTDIHGHIEVRERIHGARWEHEFKIVGRPCYNMFSVLAGVRRWGPFSRVHYIEPKGLPDDITLETREDYEKWADVAHHCSFVNHIELYDAMTVLRIEADRGYGDVLEEYHAILDYMCAMVRYGDVRLVFWFDN